MIRQVRRLCVAVIMAGLVASAAAAQQDVPLRISSWRFSVSDSPTDSQSNTGAPFVGERDLYLWTDCSVLPFDRTIMDLTSSFELVSFVPDSGVTVVTGVPTLELAFECRSWGRLGTLTVRDVSGTGGEVCMGSARRTRWCLNPVPEEHSYWGYSTLGGGEPCHEGECGIDYVDPLSWGKVKAYFQQYGE